MSIRKDAALCEMIKRLEAEKAAGDAMMKDLRNRHSDYTVEAYQREIDRIHDAWMSANGAIVALRWALGDYSDEQLVKFVDVCRRGRNDGDRT